MQNLSDLRASIHSKGYPSPQRLLVVITMSIFTVETLVMVIIIYLPKMSNFWETMLDATLLTSFILPMLFLFFYRPFLRYIDSLKSAEDNLMRYATAIEQGVESIVITDQAGKILYVNPAFTETTGYAWSETVGNNPRMWKSNRHDATFYKNIWDTINSGQVWRGEFINRKKNGQMYYDHARIAPIKNSDGQIINFVAVGQDVTNEKLAEVERGNYVRQVEELSRYNQNLIEKAPIGVWIIDFQKLTENDKQTDPCYGWHEQIGAKVVTEMVNDEMAKMLGHTKEDMADKSIFDPMFVDEENARRYVDEIIHRQSGEKGSYELTLKHKSGEDVFVDIEAMPTATDPVTGKVVQSLGMFLDLTARKHAESQREMLILDLNRANEELRDFAYIVSHDLKAPLRAIGSLAEWLAKDYIGVLDEEGQENLQLLLGRTKRMNNLIEGILRYSRAGRVKPELDTLDSGKIARVVVDAISPPPNIKVSIQGSLPMVIYDRTHLEQLFQNLVSNAIKHLGKPDGEVSIACRDDGDFWEFCVRDNGQGIDEKHFDRIFKIFQSLKARDELESTGIGLTLVKKIVEIYGGSVWVKSKTDVGSEFYFTIPKVPQNVDDDTAKILARELNELEDNKL